jgi:hypothetical protein
MIITFARKLDTNYTDLFHVTSPVIVSIFPSNRSSNKVALPDILGPVITVNLPVKITIRKSFIYVSSKGPTDMKNIK